MLLGPGAVAGSTHVVPSVLCKVCTRLSVPVQASTKVGGVDGVGGGVPVQLGNDARQASTISKMDGLILMSDLLLKFD